MSLVNQQLSAPVLDTRIPEGRRVRGLVYGAHVSQKASGWSGHYVSPDGGETWGVARMTPAGDELRGDDAEIVSAIRDELGLGPQRRDRARLLKLTSAEDATIQQRAAAAGLNVSEYIRRRATED